MGDMGRRAALASCEFEWLPPELLVAILACLPLPDRLPLSTVSRQWLAAVRAAGAASQGYGVAVPLHARSRDVPAVHAAVNTVALVAQGACAAAAAAVTASQAARWDPQEQQLWEPAAGRGRRPAAAAWHLRRAIGTAAEAGRQRRSLALLLVAPEWDASAAEVRRMLAAAGAEQLVGSVAVPAGLLRLDGSLAGPPSPALIRCNTRAASLPAALAATSYARLERLALKLAPSDDLPAALGCIHAGSLPALRCLALLAAAGEVSEDLSSLAHGGITRLDLRNVQLPAGFACLQQLTGLRMLAVRYDDEEEEVPPLNLHGDLSALSHLKQLADLSLDGLASGEGLPALAALTTLALSPAQGARITLRGMLRLQRLVCDLGGSGSGGRELLSERSSVHVPAEGHGLGGLTHLELRCFVWQHWEASSGGGSGGGSEDGSGSEGGSEGAGSAADSEAADGSSSGGSGWDEWEQEGDATSSSSGSSGGGGSEDGSAASGSEAGMEMEEADGWEAEAAEGGGGEVAAEEEGEEGEEQAAGLLEASWGFLQQGRTASGGSGGQDAPAIVSLEQGYISALLERMPTLASIQLTDFMGLVDPPALLAGAAPQAAAKPAALGTAAAREAAAAGLGGTSRAGTPGLLGAGAAVGSAAGGAAGSSLVGWRREVAETPVPGGISQYDVSFTRCC